MKTHDADCRQTTNPLTRSVIHRLCRLLLLLLLSRTLPAYAGCDGFGGSGGDCGGTVPPGGVLIIPSTFADGQPVTRIADRAFAGNSYLTSVIIPDSVTNIGAFAFVNCYSLTNVTMGSGIVEIGEQAFRSCDVRQVSISRSVVAIGNKAFSACLSLTAITVDPLNTNYASSNGVLFTKDVTALIQCPGLKTGAYVVPPSVTDIRESAFYYCHTLSSVVMSDGVKGIGEAAFSFCGATNITVGNGITNIGNGAFASCWALTSIRLPQSLLTIPDSLFQECSGLHAVRIPDSVTRIGDQAFDRCTSMTAVTIPNNVTSVGYRGFYCCKSLVNIAIPSNVNSIGFQAFIACDSLQAIDVDARNSVYSSVDGVLYDKGGTLLIQCPGAKTGIYTVPDGVTGIGPNAFGLCNGLTQLTFPSSISHIGQYAFAYADNLTNFYFRGNAPIAFSDLWDPWNDETIYYLPGTSGWDPTFQGRPTALWSLPNPVILDFAPSFGVQNNAFGFIISWATNVPVAVEACTDPAAANWSTLSTNTLSNGWSYFTDPEWTNYPSRIYRVRSQ